MLFLTWMIFVAWIVKINAESYDVSFEHTFGEDGIQPHIVNGREAKEGEFPWMGALHFKEGFRCSSSILTPNILLTAAHCVIINGTLEPPSAFHVIIGNVRRQGPDTRVEFSRIAIHPDYTNNQTDDGDIAVMWFSEPVSFNQNVKPVCLPSAGRDFQTKPVRAMGWGKTSTNAPNQPENLMTTELKVDTRYMCRLFFSSFNTQITERHVCASSTRATGACFGDSGSPLIFEDPENKVPLAIGVAAFITPLGCGAPMAPTVYSRTAAYTEWLKETLGDDISDVCFV